MFKNTGFFQTVEALYKLTILFEWHPHALFYSTYNEHENTQTKKHNCHVTAATACGIYTIQNETV
jgi:hypothetical protein